MVRGLCTQRSGVGLRGEVGPKAPMVLGTNRRKPCSAAMSRMLWSPEGRAKGGPYDYNVRASAHRRGERFFTRDRFEPPRANQRVLTGDVDGAREGDVSLSNGAEQGAVVNQPGDAVVHHDLPQVLVVQDVRVDEGA